MAMVIIGRLARDADKAHPGQVLQLDALLPTVVGSEPEVAVRSQPLAPTPLLRSRQVVAHRPQSASFVNLY